MKTTWFEVLNFPTVILFSPHLYLKGEYKEKELSLCNKIWFSNPYVFSTQCSKPLIFQTMKYVRLNNPSLKYQRFTPTSSRDMGIRTFEFVAKTQILCQTNKS